MVIRPEILARWRRLAHNCHRTAGTEDLPYLSFMADLRHQFPQVLGELLELLGEPTDSDTL